MFIIHLTLPMAKYYDLNYVHNNSPLFGQDFGEIICFQTRLCPLSTFFQMSSILILSLFQWLTKSMPLFSFCLLSSDIIFLKLNFKGVSFNDLLKCLRNGDLFFNSASRLASKVFFFDLLWFTGSYKYWVLYGILSITDSTVLIIHVDVTPDIA